MPKPSQAQAATPGCNREHVRLFVKGRLITFIVLASCYHLTCCAIKHYRYININITYLLKIYLQNLLTCVTFVTFGSGDLGQGHSADKQTVVGVIMAYVLRTGCRIFSEFQTLSVNSHCLASLQGLVSRRCVAAGSSEHTLAVRQQIHDARKRGQEAGGAKRIQSQHEKVVN